MDGLKISLKRRGKRRRGTVPLGGNSSVQRHPTSGFGDGEDSDDSQPRPKPVTRVVNSAPSVAREEASNARRQEPARTSTLTEEPSVRERGAKQSQIARLVERRREAERELQDLPASGDGKDEALFRYDIDKCPEHAALSAYESTPVDGFGESMLRAMGWKGPVKDDARGSKSEPGHLERAPRPPRLGLGAKLGALPGEKEANKKGRPIGTPNGVEGSSNGYEVHRDPNESEDEISRGGVATDSRDRCARASTADKINIEDRKRRANESDDGDQNGSRKRSRFSNDRPRFNRPFGDPGIETRRNSTEHAKQTVQRFSR